ncbi:heme ABC transporter substrate-binding protein IsdE [Paenibacillus sp. CGMCC 1.16610]|uniref:High-affinity heme uptake system protein IsdE n=1 Tax=Paenibacillus anseongense TaxID=2682845 RepID=A0ABW9UG76_9BACL|nr:MULTISPECIES: heme ABC transporter substrate-binding protein IsdE [Paenibacillus]MBA2942800.1 heme ABC transporter substrate-binding protein IsdE [Paenibacillus sp. CGMCC 1.16610]MVQ38285.1 heme ABC transporter substrate-binding protein IsdE [Paenibacillus anseongense]
MNKRMGAILLAGMLVMTAACSSGTPSDSNAAASQTAAPAADVQNEKRVIATTVAAAQIMDALEMDLVGVPTSTKELPKRYDGATKVGNPMSPNMEVVKSLDPTDVLSVTTLEYDLAPVLKNAAVDATFLNLTSLEKMNKEIIALGDKYNRQKQAQAIVAKYQDKQKEINQKIAGKKQPSVLILLGVPGSYLVATENSYIGDLVKLAGGINVVQGQKVEYLASNTEYLQQANPDIILRAAHGLPDEVIKMFDKEFQKNDIWKHFEAVQHKRVYDLQEDLFGTTGNLAATEALDELVKMLYSTN